MTIEERFWNKVEMIPFHPCWEWIAGRDKDGYGSFRLNQPRKKVRAHRFSYELHFGSIPEGMLICHKCDNPSCVRPDHLFIGTAKDNVRDKFCKNRQSPHLPISSLGEEHHSHKLSGQDVLNIREQHRKGHSIASLARQYKMGETPIRRIVKRERWKHID